MSLYDVLVPSIDVKQVDAHLAHAVIFGVATSSITPAQAKAIIEAKLGRALEQAASADFSAVVTNQQNASNKEFYSLTVNTAFIAAANSAISKTAFDSLLGI